MHKHTIFFFFLPVAALPQWELSVKVVKLLGLWGPWWCQVCRDTDCLLGRTYDLIRVFFWASCSWPSEGLFGQSFSIAPPVHTLRGIPCLRSFSVVWRIRHIEGLVAAVLLCSLVHQSLKGAPWVGSYSVVQCVRCLMGQPLQLFTCQCWCVGRERLWWWLHPLRMTQQYCLPSMAARPFFHRHFPPWSPPSYPLNLSLRSQQQPSH